MQQIFLNMKTYFSYIKHITKKGNFFYQFKDTRIKIRESRTYVNLNTMKD